MMINTAIILAAGVKKLTAQYGRKLSAWLEENALEGRRDEFKDQVIGDHIDDHPIYACDISGLRWGEIDTVEDIHRIEVGFSPMKYVVVIIDGAADNPVAQLDNKTPLEYANIPNIDKLAKEGKTGLVRTMYPGLPLGSIVACLGIMGYNDNAPDEESHRKNVSAKVQILETIDEQIIGPLKQYMDDKYPDKYRIAVLPDHYSLLENGKHGSDPVPYLIYGSGVQKDGVFTFCERNVSDSSIIKSYEFMEFLRSEA